MAENITSVLDKDEAGTLSFADVLYIIQGDGADRDRNVTLERIRDFFSLNFKEIKVSLDNMTFSSDNENSKFTFDSRAGVVSMLSGAITVETTVERVTEKAALDHDSLNFYEGSTEKARYTKTDAHVGPVTLDSNGVKVSGQGGNSILEDDELKFSGTGINATYNGSGFTVKYGNLTMSLENNARSNSFSISGQGGGCTLTQDSLSITGSGKTTSVTNTSVSTGNLTCSNISTQLNVNAGGTVTAAKLKTSGGLVLKHLDSVDQLPSNPEDGEMYMVKYGDADALYIFDAKTNNKWRTVSLGGVYPA